MSEGNEGRQNKSGELRLRQRKGEWWLGQNLVHEKRKRKNVRESVIKTKESMRLAESGVQNKWRSE